jgi:putative tryptophan/tyrosine transport system substrate-binding protein
MRRRDFVRLNAGGAIAAAHGAVARPLAALAQTANKVPTIGYLAANSEVTDRPRRAAFVRRLGELGWTEGHSVRIAYRWADGVVGNAAAIAAEFMHSKVDVIVTGGDAYVLATKQATGTIPIVFASAGDPVGNGLVQSLARPGGNVTGLSIELTESVGKRLELLREIVPALHGLAILFNAGDPQVKLEMDAVLADARRAGFHPVSAEIRPDQDIAPAIEALKGRVEALYVCLDPLTYTNAGRINAVALAARLPVVQTVRQQAEAGGLISYGPDFPDMSRRAAEIVDKILRGTKPAEIPVEQPTKFDLVVNLKTAKVLGLTVSPTLLATADEVIE